MHQRCSQPTPSPAFHHSTFAPCFPCPRPLGPVPAHRIPHPMIKMGYFSVGLLQLTFSRPGETLKDQKNKGKNPQKSGPFLSWNTQPCSIARKTAKERGLYFFCPAGVLINT